VVGDEIGRVTERREREVAAGGEIKRARVGGWWRDREGVSDNGSGRKGESEERRGERGQRWRPDLNKG